MQASPEARGRRMGEASERSLDVSLAKSQNYAIVHDIFHLWRMQADEEAEKCDIRMRRWKNSERQFGISVIFVIVMAQQAKPIRV